jgi:anthranilate synthase component I
MEAAMETSSTRKDAVIRTIPGEKDTPFALAARLGAKALLESRSLDRRRERYSILLITEAFTVIQRDEAVSIEREGTATPVGDPGDDILDVVLRIAGENAGRSWDFPFPAGGIGFLSYEFLRFCDSFSLRDKPDPLGVPDAAYIFGHVYLIFDHYTDTILLLGLNYGEHEIDLEAECIRVAAKIGEPDAEARTESKRHPIEVENEAGERDRYIAGVESIKREIVAGNLLQGVLSRRLYLKTEMSALEAYRALRTVNPSPYLFYLDFGGYQIFGSSPEVMLKCRGGRLVMRPIAGTRKRGKTPAEDEALEAELRADEKEKAEHRMLVDLARNDLGRVSVPGSVKVTEFMAVERYSHAMHLVSEVEGRLSPGLTGIEAIRAVFPAGTVSGAPKIRAVQIVDSLEGEKRGFYAGLVGYMEPDGNMDTCITIRSGLRKDGRIILQAGAGIVFDSIPEREFEETGIKLAALSAAVGLEEAHVPADR